MTNAAVVDGQWVPEVDIATRLRLVRREYGRKLGKALTQEEMADLIGVAPSSYKQWEAGNSRPRDIVKVSKRISRVTGVAVGWLLDLDDEPNPTDGTPLATQRLPDPHANSLRFALLRGHAVGQRFVEKELDFDGRVRSTVTARVAA